jgi:hypothetical protein
MSAAARRIDSFGLKERILTAWEQRDQDNSLALMQRLDAVSHLQAQKENIRISLRPQSRHLLAFCLSMLCLVVLAAVPSDVRTLAKEQHILKQEAKEKEKELSELIREMEKIDTDSLTDEQQNQLQELLDSMQLSAEELSNISSGEALAAAQQKLDYKYQQAASELSNLANQVTDPQQAGIASAQAMAQAAAGSNTQTASATGATAAASDSQSGNANGDGDGSGDANGDGSGDGSGNSDGNSSGNGSGSGDGSGDGDGNGDGNGSGNGSGSGTGTGSGNGNGSGGSGRGTGSGSQQHDYVSVPNQLGDDENLTGNKTGSDNSDYYRAQNGLAWEGDHVSLDSVIGQYTQDAYDGIAGGKYPSGMEDVIKDYFKNLTD